MTSEGVMEIILIFDISGSMNQMGKIHLQRNLCRYVAQLSLINPKKYANFKFLFYQWAEEVRDFSMQKDGAITLANPEGSANFAALSDFILQNLKERNKSVILILSDGHFQSSDISDFIDQLKTITAPVIRTVAIGADADLLKLKKISTNSSVYLSENISEAINCIAFGANGSVKEPKNLAQIQSSILEETDEA